MAKIKKIEDRTLWFLSAYDRLEKDGLLPTNVELARIMGMSSKSTITNILNKEQNIQPDQWERFKGHFKLGERPSDSEKNEPPTTLQILAGLTEGFKAIAETMRSIENKMAREDTLADVAKNLQRVLGGLEVVAERQYDSIKEFRGDLKDIKSQTKVPS